MSKPEWNEPWLVERRQIPFGFGWLPEVANPYRELPGRAIRLVFRELPANPDLPDDQLRARLGRELFGRDWQPAQVDDLFFLFQVFNTDRDWSVPGALTTPGLVQDRAERGKLDARELHHIAQWLADQWTLDNTRFLN